MFFPEGVVASVIYDASELGEGMAERILVIRIQSGQTGIFVARPSIEGVTNSPPASLLSMLPAAANSRKKVQIALVNVARRMGDDCRGAEHRHFH